MYTYAYMYTRTTSRAAATRAHGMLGMAGLQRRLDELNIGRWSSAAGPSGTAWVPDAGALRPIEVSGIRRCLGKPHVWIHLLGDSTVRFMYAAWLTLLNGTERAPGFPR